MSTDERLGPTLSTATADPDGGAIDGKGPLMRLALISDVHANATALRAVLDELESLDVDRVVCAGDVVGYGPDPAACVELVRESADVVVAGNHDRMVETPDRYAAHPTAGPGLSHAADSLSEPARAWLRSLDSRTRLANASVVVAHSHPDPGRRGEYVYPDGFSAVESAVDADYLVLGHTHVQGVHEGEETVVVNPGSVGQPRDGDPAAAYALVDTDARTVDCRRVGYDVEAVVDRIEKAGLPEETGERLRTGR